MLKKRYEELIKARITDTRKVIISRINDGGGYKIVELAEFTEGDRKQAMILKGGIEVDSLENLANFKDALDCVVQQERHARRKQSYAPYSISSISSVANEAVEE